MIQEVAALKGLGHRGQILAISTVLPGLILTLEFIVLTAPADTFGTLSDFTGFFREATRGISLLGGLVLLVMAALLGLVVGLVSREIVFTIVNHLDKRWEDDRLRTRDALQALTVVYGEAAVAAFLSRHPIREVLAAQGNAKDGSRPNVEGLDPESEAAKTLDSWRGYIFSYAKHWLRARQPSMSVDFFEFEINLFFGIIPPLWGLLLIAARGLVEASYEPRPTTIAIAVTAIAIAMASRYCWRSAKSSKLKEHERALRYLFFADRAHEAKLSASNEVTH